MLRKLFAAALFLGIAPALAAPPPPVPPIADANRYQSYNLTTATASVGVTFPVFGDCTDLVVQFNGVPLVLNTDFTCASTAGGPTLDRLPLPITDLVITFSTIPTTNLPSGNPSDGFLEIIGAWHPRDTVQATAPGINRREFNETISTLVAAQRETWGSVAQSWGTGTLFGNPGTGPTRNRSFTVQSLPLDTAPDPSLDYLPIYDHLTGQIKKVQPTALAAIIPGPVDCAQLPALTGDVTTAGSSCATTVSSIGGKPVMLAAGFSTSGAFSLAFTTTGPTNVTLPVSGTLATTAGLMAALPSAITSQFYCGTGAAGTAGVCTVGGGLSVSGGVLSSLAVVPRSYLAGFTLSTAGSSATFGIAAGSAANSTNAYLLTLSSAFTKTAAAWAAGTGNGCLDTGTIAASSWYAVFVIGTSTGGNPDVICHLEVAGTAPSPTLPASYSGGVYRYVGSMKTDTSSNWTAFVQNGDYFYRPPTTDFNVTSSYSAALTTLNVPLGVVVQPLVSMQVGSGSAGTQNTLSVGPGAGTTSMLLTVAESYNYAAYTAATFPPTNLSGQVYLAAALANGNALVLTGGWMDNRGRSN